MSDVHLTLEPCVARDCECKGPPCWFGYSMMFGFDWKEVKQRQEESNELEDDEDRWAKDYSCEYFISRLEAAGLHTSVSSDADNCYIRVGARMSRLMEEAARIGFRKRIKDECVPKPLEGAEDNCSESEETAKKIRKGDPNFLDIDPGRDVREDRCMAIHAQFSMKHKHLFSNSLLDPTAFFCSAERQQLTQSIIEASFLDTGCNISLDTDIVLWGYQLGSPIMLHDYEERARLQRLWSFGKPFGVLIQSEGDHEGVFWSKQPFHEIREYYGETITMYYAWMDHYITWLKPAAIVGFVCWIPFIAGLTEAVYLYGLFIVFWSALFLEYWKRRESDLAFMWDVYNKDAIGREHPDFPENSVRRNHPVTGKSENYFDPAITSKRSLISGIISFCCCLIALGLNFIAIYMGMNGLAQPFGNLVSSIGLVVSIELTKLIYEMIADHLTAWENHKMLFAFDQSLGLKIFSFEFCVKFASVFIVAFVKGYLNNPANDNDSGCNPPETEKFCHKDLQTQVLTIFGSEMTIGQFMEVAVPLIKQKINAHLSEKAEAEALAALQGENGEEGLVNPEEQAAAAEAEADAAVAAEKEAAAVAEARRQEDIEPLKVEGVESLGLDEAAASARAERMSHLYAFRRLRVDPEDCKQGDGEWVTEDQENEAEKGDYWLEGGERPDYQEMCIQFGWVAIFSMGAMIAPALAWLNNIVEIRTDALGMDQTMQRPQYRSSCGLGVWYNVLYFISFISILSNMLLFIKYNQISGNAWFDESSGNTLAAVIVVGEHGVILIKLLCENLIPDMTPWLNEALEGHDYLVNRVLSGVEEPDAVDIEKDDVECHVADAKIQVKFHYSAYFETDGDNSMQDDMQMLKMGPDIKNPLADENHSVDLCISVDEEVKSDSLMPPTWGGNKTEDAQEADEESDPNAKMGQLKTFDECPENLKELINASFTRYDLDDSGFIDAEMELHQLCTNLAYSLHVDQGFEFIWDEVKIKGQSCEMDVPIFAEWFLCHFKWEFIEDGEKLVCAGINSD